VKDIKIEVHHVTRVEGHGNIVLNARDGKIEKIQWEIPESPRLFEAMLVGRNYQDVPYIASRICGICSIAHTTASIQAVEASFGIRPTEQTVNLRKLLFNAELLESHVLHTLFLAAPDFLGVESVFPLINTHKETVLMAVKLKRLAYKMAEIIAGRKTHPLSCVVDGFTKLPAASDLRELKSNLDAVIPDVDAIVALMKTLQIPDFIRDTEYVALKDAKEYAFISGDIASSDTFLTPLTNYQNITNEFCVPHSTAKFTKHNRDSYMVGALSRFNLNFDQLLPLAKKAAAELGIKPQCHNPYMITVAQVVETAHVIEDSINLIDQILSSGIKDEKPEVKVKSGRGIGAVEAPRGILFHDYTFNEKGICTKANCIIPTNQNHNNIQKDLEKLVPKIIDQPEDKIRLSMEMLVRAYDPCISCSTHMLNITIKK
jgi:sulfhydrogenase subunit alpha